MIAQNTIPNDGVLTGAPQAPLFVTSDDATVRAAVKLLTLKRPMLVQRWTCETCGMIHTGPLPTSCDSCGADASLIHQPNFRSEISSRW